MLTVVPLIKLIGGENIADVAKKVIGVGIGLVVAGVMLPLGLEQIASGTYTDVDPAVKTIATVVLPILGVVAVAYAFYKM